MSEKINKTKFNKSLEEVFSSDIQPDKSFVKNLDRVVASSIRVQKAMNTKEKKNIFEILFSGIKFQSAFLTSFVIMLLCSGVAFATYQPLREIIKPTKGDFSIETEPTGASVNLKKKGSLEYQNIGTTPIKTKLEAGDYEIEITLEGYSNFTKEISIEAGKKDSLDIILKSDEDVLELIKEWKTYIDEQNGFEVIYPLLWDFNNDDNVLIIGENSQIEILKDLSTIDACDVDKNIIINDTKYSGIKNSGNWEYVVCEKFISTDGNNILYLVFSTKKSEEIDIFNFISANFVIKNIEEKQINDFSSYNNTEFGFSFQYPSDLVVIERKIDDSYSEFLLEDMQGNINIKFIYSRNYFDELNAYEIIEKEANINGFTVKKYCKNECSEVLYEMPERFFINYFLNEDMNDEILETISTFNITGNYKYQSVYEYDLGLILTMPEDYNYSSIFTYDEEEYSELIRFIRRNDDDPTIELYKKSEKESFWEDLKLKNDIDFIENSYFEIMLDGKLRYGGVFRYQEKSATISKSQLCSTYMLLLSDQDFTENENIIDPYIDLEGENYFIMSVFGGSFYPECSGENPFVNMGDLKVILSLIKPI